MQLAPRSPKVGLKNKSVHSRCASLIRAELKAAFPGIKFSVSSSSFSMGNAVNVEWTDGPLNSSVEDILAKYQMGHYSSESDIYELDNSNHDLPQVKWVQVCRQMSEQTKACLNEWAETLITDIPEMRTNELRSRLFRKTDIPANKIMVAVTASDKTSGFLEDMYCAVLADQ